LLGAGCQMTPAPDVEASASLSPNAATFGDAFWETWGDGQAELIGYDFTVPRYGHLRGGIAVTIFVTETLSNELRVKGDPGKHPASDEVPVMKLNLVEDFPTGIYDYNLMTSSFVALQPVDGRPAGAPMKVSFSAQEWCGHVYSQLLFDAGSVRQTLHSYFDGEADQQNRLDYPADGIAEDALWFWARGWAGPPLEPGGSASVKLLISLAASRTRHEPLAWRAATLSRSASSEQISVPAGGFTVERWTAQVEGGTSRTFFVEAAAPHRIIRWETSDGEQAEMLAGERLQYWKMNAPEFVTALEKLGLSPRPARTP